MRVLNVVQKPSYLPPSAFDRIPVKCFVEVLPAGERESVLRVLVLRPSSVVNGPVNRVALLAYAFYPGGKSIVELRKAPRNNKCTRSTRPTYP